MTRQLRAVAWTTLWLAGVADAALAQPDDQNDDRGAAPAMVQDQSQVQSQVQPQVQPQAQPQVQSQVQSQVQPQDQPQVQPQVQSQDQPQAQPQIQLQTHDGAGLPPPPPPAVPPAQGNAWNVAMLGFLQADAVALDQSSQNQLSPAGGEALNTQRFLVRRAHVLVEAQRSALAARIEMDANTIKGMSVGLARAELALGRGGPDRNAELGLGLLRIPFGLEVQEWDPDRYFLERSNVSRALFPGTFDLGARVKGAWRFLRAQVAVMNGNPLGDATFPARDPNAAKDLVGRLGVDATVAGKVHLRAGGSALKGTGFHSGTPATKDVLVWRDQNEDGIVQLSEIQVIPGRAATPSQDFSRFAVGVDGRLDATVPRLGRLMVFGELVWGANLDRGLVPADPVASGRDLRELGWVVGASQELTARAAFGFRYDYYNPDLDGFRQTPTAIAPKDMSFRTWTFTLSWGGAARDRLSLEYQRNRNTLALAADGSPTSLAADTLTLRGQMVFQ